MIEYFVGCIGILRLRLPHEHAKITILLRYARIETQLTAKMFHSATGLIFPGDAIAPPITETLATLRLTSSGLCRTAVAKLDKGPITIQVTELSSCSASMSRMCLW